MVGLFGGSFDPVHHGHLIVARAVQEALGLELVRFVPAREQPFKRGTHGAPPEHRARMLELAIAGEPGWEIDRLELERPGPSYTVDTLRVMHEREPGVELALLVGADAAREFPQWREAGAVAALATLVVFGREGEPPPAGLPSGARQVTVPRVDISATALRARVAAGRSIRYFVPDAVAGWVATHRLYEDGKAC